jgi:inhibitor of KinA
MLIMRMQPLGDQAVLAYCPDEAAAANLALLVRKAAFPWTVDVVQAYTSVAIYYDLAVTDFEHAAALLAVIEPSAAPAEHAPQTHTIPCCYEMGLDWPRLQEHTRLTIDELITLHAEKEYTVYAIGFCPGFPYMGYLDEKIAGIPRLPSPRLKLEAGSVGLTGNQTGIYTEERPGGWNIVGRTPLELVNVRDAYFPLRTGDRVRFSRIDARTFRKLAGQRLPNIPYNEAGAQGTIP